MSKNGNKPSTTTPSTPVVVPKPVDVSAWRKELILKAGISVQTGAKAKSANLSYVREQGGYIPDNASPEVIALAGAVAKQSHNAAKAAREAAIALGILDMTETYASLTGPDGKAFRSAKAMYTAMFPGLSPKTVASYVNAARTIYIPSLTANDKTAGGKALKALAALEPGTALSACGALNDDNSREKFMAAVNDHVSKGGRLSQAAVKGIAAESRKDSAVKADKANKADRTGTVDDTTAKAGMAEAEVKAEILRCLVVDKDNDEINIRLPEDRKTDFRKLLRDMNSEGNSRTFIEVLYKILF